MLVYNEMFATMLKNLIQLFVLKTNLIDNNF